jgi:hypothetical protein
MRIVSLIAQFNSFRKMKSVPDRTVIPFIRTATFSKTRSFLMLDVELEFSACMLRCLDCGNDALTDT